MRLVLDSNEYIFALGTHRKKSCELLIDKIADTLPKHFIHLVPFELGAKYEERGLKKADAFIAGFTEWSGSEFLISENRHFLISQKNLPFKIFNAEAFLKIL